MRSYLLFWLLAAGTAAWPAAPFRAGAARVDITPSADEALQLSGYAGRKEGHKGIHDPLAVRAIALDDGRTKAGIVTADLIGFSHDFWDRTTERMAAEAGIPRENVLLAGTHTHAAPNLGTYGGSIEERQARYIRRVEDALVEALRGAAARLEPARVGAGAGRANVNVNRRAQMHDGSWWLGVNPDGPSDKTLAVLKVETLEGLPIAVFVNYAVHGTGMGQENYLISGDIPGATSLYIERRLGPEVVAAWTSSAGGDQCPIYDRETKRFDGVLAIGRLLGEETLRVLQTIRTSPGMRLRASQRVLSCPGQKLTPGPRSRPKYEWVDADPVPIRLSLLRIGKDVALAGVSGEVLTPVGLRLKKALPVANTIMVTHCNGSSGYLPDDAAYAQVSYEIQVARVKPGCAERGIVETLLEMVR